MTKLKKGVKLKPGVKLKTTKKPTPEPKKYKKYPRKYFAKL